jgi:NADPH-dependent ferric siderophore reductase
VTVIRRTPLHAATVVDAHDLTPRMRRITLSARTLDQPRPAQDVELVLADDTGRKVKRRYTITRHRNGRFDIDALLHGDAPGATWAARAAPGDDVQFFGPRGRLELRGADWHLFIGDESALPAIAELAMAVRTPAYALLEVGDDKDELPVAADVRWLHRGATPPGGPDLLAAAVDAFAPPPGTGHAYAMGESRVVAALRPRLHVLGIPNEQLYVKGYWNVGRVAVSSRTSA